MRKSLSTRCAAKCEACTWWAWARRGEASPEVLMATSLVPGLNRRSPSDRAGLATRFEHCLQSARQARTGIASGRIADHGREAGIAERGRRQIRVTGADARRVSAAGRAEIRRRPGRALSVLGRCRAAAQGLRPLRRDIAGRRPRRMAASRRRAGANLAGGARSAPVFAGRSGTQRDRHPGGRGPGRPRDAEEPALGTDLLFEAASPHVQPRRTVAGRLGGGPSGRTHSPRRQSGGGRKKGAARRTDAACQSGRVRPSY